MSTVSMVVGAVTPAGATFVAKVDGGGPVRVAAADNPGMAGPVLTASQAVDAQGVAKVAITGLDPATRYHWQVEDNGVIDTAVTGQFLTHPPLGLPATFTMGTASCAGGTASVPGVSGSELAPTRVSNHPVFETIRGRAVAEGWTEFLHTGDIEYYEPGSGLFVPDGSLATCRTAYDDLLAQPHQAGLYRSLGLDYIWDDHDFGPNNGDGTHVDKPNLAAAYRERMPHRTLPDPNAIYHTWDVSRVRVVAFDVRYNRSPNADPDGPTKTMLGAAQKTWLDGLLADPGPAQLLVLMMGSQWIHPSGIDTWASFATERDELVQMFGDHGWLGRMLAVYGDRHGAGVDSGGGNPWGGFPILCAASLDSDNSGGPGDPDLFDVVRDTPGRGQYGTMELADFGNVLQLTLATWRGAGLLGSYRHTIALGTPVVGSATVAQFAPVVTGSHDPVFEARLLTSFQSGPEPAGDDLPIVGGDVQFDATAQVLATAQVTTQGTDPATGRPWFPRLHDDPLGPYGNELFLRRGVDLGGGGILWSPLGYFRVETVEQATDVEADITISGSDRMAGLIEAGVLAPTEFPATIPVASFFAALVGDVYPQATIIFDDDAGLAELGRQIVVDESRYEPLLEVADGLGKVLFWDSEGRLRIESPPDETMPVWTVRAGRGGVLVEASRRISRRGAPNGVLVIGEGAGDAEPVRGVAVDAGPRSPTRWGGPYGRVLAREQLPTVTTGLQAEQAAREILRRRLGVPHSADFGAVVNPAVRPRMPIVVILRDGNRDRHIVQTVTVPLRAGVHMTGSTRERASLVVGNVIT